MKRKSTPCQDIYPLVLILLSRLSMTALRILKALLGAPQSFLPEGASESAAAPPEFALVASAPGETSQRESTRGGGGRVA